MSVQRVVITTADEKFEPPSQEIEITVIDGKVFITVYDGSQDNVPSDRQKRYEVPEIDLHDLVRALTAFGVAVQGVLVSSAAGAP